MIELWSDGSSTGTSDCDGGWAYILRYRGREKVGFGSMPRTTNQRMEMTAVLMGLRAIRLPAQLVTVFTDSAYVKNAWTQGWLDKWKRNGWRAGSGSKTHPVENRDLWEALLIETAKHRVQWEKVKGHGNSVLNNRVDELAVTARKAGKEAFVTVELPGIDQLALV